MDYEKKYKEALERAKKLQETCDSQAVVGWCDYLFPELKESRPNGCIVLEDFNGGEGFYKLNLDYLNEKQVEEIEEMVRTWNKESKTSNENIKNCIGMCLTDANGQRFKDYNTTLKDCLDWLKSQGEKEEPQAYKTEDDTIVTYSEKKGYNSVRLKFKVGDFVVNDYCMGRVMELTDDAYLLDTEQGIPFSCENNAHLWTVEDAKPGDVLSGKINGDNYILIFKQVTDGWVETYGHYYDVVDRFCAPSQLFCRDYQGTFAPATKEQRDLLFSKMKEAGYEWDTKRKELRKIEWSASWDEEDESRMNNLCYFLEEYGTQYYGGLTLEFTISWLKSLKQRAGG